MERDPFPGWTHLTQTQLGILFGVSSHVIGRWLSALGLKQGSAPTEVAWKHGLCRIENVDDRHFPSWHKENVVKLFEAKGHRRVDLPQEPQEPPIPSDTINLAGPFTVEPGSEDGYALVGSDGKAALWVRGLANAQRVGAILDLAHKCGRLAKPTTSTT